MYKLFILITSLSILATAQAAGAAPEEQITTAPQPMSMSSAAGNPRLHEAQYAPALQYTALLKLHQDAWLICQDCGRKYPIVDDIPVMLIDEGDKWIDTAPDQLPVPPPAK